jgi:hypothetical protein
LCQHGEAFRHELDKFRAPVAAIEPEFHSKFFEREQPSLA